MLERYQRRRLFARQWGSKKGLLQSTKQLRMANAKLTIFLGPRAMDDVHQASLDDTKKDTRRFGRGLGKGSGVLLLGVTASFLSMDTFGRNDGNRAIVAGYFC